MKLFCPIRASALEDSPKLFSQRSSPGISGTDTDVILKMVDYFTSESTAAVQISTTLLGLISQVEDFSETFTISGRNYFKLDATFDTSAIPEDFSTCTISVPGVSVSRVTPCFFGLESMAVESPSEIKHQWGYVKDGVQCPVVIRTDEGYFLATSLQGYDGASVGIDRAYSAVANHATAASVMSSLTTMCATAISSNERITFSDVSGAVMALTGNANAGSTDLSSMVAEILDAATQSTDPYILASTLKSIYADSNPTGSSNTAFVFTDNGSIMTKTVASVVIEGIVNALPSLITLIGVTIGGVLGIAVAVGAQVVNIANKVLKSTAHLDYARYQSGIQGCYPYGLIQTSNKDLGISKTANIIKATESTGLGFGSLPYLYAIVNYNSEVTTPKIEVHLRECTTNPARLQSLITISGANNVLYFPESAEVVQSASDDLAEYTPVRTLPLSEAEVDELQRKTYVYSVAYFLLHVLSTRFNGYGGSSNYIKNSTVEGVWSSIYAFLSVIKTTGWSSEFTWEAIGGGGSGAGYHLGVITSWLMTRDSWWQKDVPASLWGGTLSDVSQPFGSVVDASGSNVYGYGATALYSGFVPDIIPPRWSSRGLASLLVAITFGIALGATTIFVAKHQALKAMRKSQAKRAADAERAWTQYLRDPSDENYSIYLKSAKRNNRLSRLTGGTIYSLGGFWGSSENSTSDISLIQGINKLLPKSGEPTIKSVSEQIAVLSGKVDGTENRDQLIYHAITGNDI